MGTKKNHLNKNLLLITQNIYGPVIQILELIVSASNECLDESGQSQDLPKPWLLEHKKYVCTKCEDWPKNQTRSPVVYVR